MPSTIYRGSTNHENKVGKPTETFTGEVFMDRVSNDGIAIVGTVTFTPCARTFWHTHEHGQVIRVLSGTGWICDKGGVPRRIQAGDTIWAAAGTTHWVRMSLQICGVVSDLPRQRLCRS